MTGDSYLDSLLGEARNKTAVPRMHVIPPTIDVVGAKVADKIRQLDSSLSGQGPGKTYVVRPPEIVLAPMIVVPKVNMPPENLFPSTIIPLDVRAPTAKLVSEQNGTGRGMPWTTSPPAFPLAGTAIGSLLVVMGRQVIAELAIAGTEEWLGGAKKRYNERGVQFRFMTGRTEADKGSIVRPRGPGGAIPEGTTPYEEPDDFSIWKPWTWF